MIIFRLAYMKINKIWFVKEERKEKKQDCQMHIVAVALWIKRILDLELLLSYTKLNETLQKDW